MSNAHRAWPKALSSSRLIGSELASRVIHVAQNHDACTQMRSFCSPSALLLSLIWSSETPGSKSGSCSRRKLRPVVVKAARVLESGRKFSVALLLSRAKPPMTA